MLIKLSNIYLKHDSYNLEKVLNFSSRLKKSLNPFKVIEKYLISVDSRLSDFPYLLS